MTGFQVDPDEMNRLRTALEDSSSSFLDRALPENPGVNVLGDPGVDAAMTSFVDDMGTHHRRFGNRFSYLAYEVGEHSEHSQSTDEEWGTAFGRRYDQMDLVSAVRRFFGDD